MRRDIWYTNTLGRFPALLIRFGSVRGQREEIDLVYVNDYRGSEEAQVIFGVPHRVDVESPPYWEERDDRSL